MENGVRRLEIDKAARSRLDIEVVARSQARAGILTSSGRRDGFIAYRPSKVFGRVLWEATGTLNDALLALERSTIDYASTMDLETWQRYHRVVDERLEAVRRAMDGVIELCGYGVRGEYEKGAAVGEGREEDAEPEGEEAAEA